MKFNKIYLVALAALLLASCKKDAIIQSPEAVAATETVAGSRLQVETITQTFSETFESGTKTAYAIGDVALASGTWSLDDALIGNSTSDPKNGTKSVRIRNTGKLTMGFNVTTGASTVTIKHAVYGSDGSSAWQLWVSSNSGSSYTQVGTTITTSSSTLATATFTVNVAGTLRFEVRKTTGGANRINLDDFTVNSYDNGTGGGGGTATDNSNLLLGNPSDATTSITFPANYLKDQTYYIESYNRDEGKPNWVSWYLSSTSLGSTARQDDFRADATLPGGWYEVGSTSYSGSGFDRGHNCPSADRTTTVAANSATFLMDNMMPQAPNNNQQTWANLENYERSLVNAGNELYVVCGSYGSGGTGSNGFATTIDNGRVKVPARTWKVIIVISNGNNDLSRITTTTRVIAVDMPNSNTISSTWSNYITTVDAIESATGYNIMSNVSAAIQSVIEARTDGGI